ncbi:Hypothetical predicted protein, partial [Marmota monax]
DSVFTCVKRQERKPPGLTHLSSREPGLLCSVGPMWAQRLTKSRPTPRQETCLLNNQ